MQTLTLPQAKQIAFDIAKQIEPHDLRDFFLVHSEKVARVAKMIAEKVGIAGDRCEIAGWVHDIGYARDFKKHADFSIPMLHELGYEVDGVLSDCISNHGSVKHPQTPEGKIFQLADKLSIFDADVIEIMLKYGTFPLNADDHDFLKTMSEKTFELLEKYS